MKYTAHITIMPLKELLDPQGKAVQSSLENLNLKQVQDVRVGKHITLQIDTDSANTAEQIAKEACEKILVNRVMETYHVSIEG